MASAGVLDPGALFRTVADARAGWRVLVLRHTIQAAARRIQHQVVMFRACPAKSEVAILASGTLSVGPLAQHLHGLGQWKRGPRFGARLSFILGTKSG